jgi:hypothetical protein
MRGAEIVRQQILEDSFQEDEHIMNLLRRMPESPAKATTRKTMRIYQDDDSDWSDPMPPPRNPLDSVERNEQCAVDYISDASEEEDADDESPAQLLARAKDIGRTGEHRGRAAASSFPSLVPRITEMDSVFEDSTTCSSLFPDLKCGMFDQGILETASQAWSGSREDASGLPQAETKPSKSPPQTSSELLQDLQVQEAEIFAANWKNFMNNQGPQATQTPQRMQPSSPPTLSFISRPRAIKGPDPTDHIVAPSSAAYYRLMLDEGHRHALRAGTLWQSIVAQHVRFPFTWWNGSRTPPMGVGTTQLWSFLGRHRVRSNPSLCQLVPSRSDPGRLLLHVLVRDVLSGEPIMDIAIGGFHPNANGIRTTRGADPQLGGCRDIWLALRSRVSDNTPIEKFLRKTGQHLQSPLGAKRAIDNSNLRSVFGERPPVYTVLVLENELYEVLTQRTTQPKSAVLLEKYFASW